MADEILANQNITTIKNLKHIWEIAPFVGKNIQLYGRMVFYPRFKGSRTRFVINGDFNLILYGGCPAGWATKQGLSFTKDKDDNGIERLISNYCIINAYLAFDFLDEKIPESYDLLYNWCLGAVPSGSWKLLYPEFIKTFTFEPQGKDCPASVCLAAYNYRTVSEFNFLFSGMENSADLVSFIRYASALEKQKEMIVQVNSNKIKNNHPAETPAGLQLANAEYMADLIPFVGKSVEMKGKIVKGNKFNKLILNDENKLAIPLMAGKANNPERPCIVKGYLVFKYLKPENNDLNFPSDGSLFLSSSEFVRLLSPEEIQGNSIPCVKQIPDIEEIQLSRKAFITGYYYDADARSLKTFIINMMKEEAKRSGSKTK